MNKNDYRLVANAIKHMKLTPLNRIFVAEHLADAFEADDKRYLRSNRIPFNREVFLEWALKEEKK